MPKKEKRFFIKKRARAKLQVIHIRQPQSPTVAVFSTSVQNHKIKPGEPGALPPSQSEVSPPKAAATPPKGIAGTSPAIFYKTQGQIIPRRGNFRPIFTWHAFLISLAKQPGQETRFFNHGTR